MYLPFFRKVDIVSYNLGVFFTSIEKMYQLHFLIQQPTSGRHFLFKRDNGQKAECSCEGTGYCQFPFHMVLGLVLGDRFIFFYKYCIKKKQLTFCHKVLVVSLWGGISWQKETLGIFFPHEFSWKKTDLGFTEVLLFQKALLASGSI